MKSPVATLGRFYEDYQVFERAPDLTPFLTVTFFGTEQDLQADLRSQETLARDSEWIFELRMDSPGELVDLTWTGSEAALERSELIHLATGDVLYPGKQPSLHLRLQESVESFVWRIYKPDEIPSDNGGGATVSAADQRVLLLFLLAIVAISFKVLFNRRQKPVQL